MDKQIDIVVIGECLIELSAEDNLSTTTSFQKFYGGDSIIAGLTAAEMGSKVALISNFGDDGFKDYLVSELSSRNIDITNVGTVPEQNGVYIVSRMQGRKNEFYYYKRKSAATKISADDISYEFIQSVKCVYATGVTQALSSSARNAVRKAFEMASANESVTAYDPNYTSCFMYSDESREFLEELLPYTKIIFLSQKNDAKQIFDMESSDQLAKYLNDNGVEIVVIKSHTDKGYYTFYNGEKRFTEFFDNVEVVDLTASGDAFNGAYLQAYLTGHTPFESTKIAAVVAGLQAGKIGAIQAIPRKEDVMRFV